MRSSRLPALMIVLPLVSGLGAGCSDSGQTATDAKNPQVRIDEHATLEKSIQDQEARIKELREQNQDLRRRLNATAPSGTSAPATP